jgi:virulence-associated protein VapD
MVATINLGPDNSVERSLKELSMCQTRFKRIQGIIRIVEQKQENASKTVLVQNDIM